MRRSHRYPQSVRNGQSYLVAWTDERNSDAATLRGERIGGSGQVLDALVLALSAPDSPTFGGVLASTGHGSVLVSWDHDDVSSFLRTVGSDGTLGAIQRVATPGGLSLASAVIRNSTDRFTRRTHHVGLVFEPKDLGK